MKKVLLFGGLLLLLYNVNVFAQMYNTPSHFKTILNSNNTFTHPTNMIGNYYTVTDMINEIAGSGIQVLNAAVDSFDGSQSPFRGPGYNPAPMYTCPVTYCKFKWVGGVSDIGIDSGMIMNSGWTPATAGNTPSSSIPGIESGIAFPSVYNTGYYNVGGVSPFLFAPWAFPPNIHLTISVTSNGRIWWRLTMGTALLMPILLSLI